jgi:hypothetical protein
VMVCAMAFELEERRACRPACCADSGLSCWGASVLDHGWLGGAVATGQGFGSEPRPVPQTPTTSKRRPFTR